MHCIFITSGAEKLSTGKVKASSFMTSKFFTLVAFQEALWKGRARRSEVRCKSAEDFCVKESMSELVITTDVLFEDVTRLIYSSK